MVFTPGAHGGNVGEPLVARRGVFAMADGTSIGPRLAAYPLPPPSGTIYETKVIDWLVFRK